MSDGYPDDDEAAWQTFEREAAEGHAALDALVDHVASGLGFLTPELALAGLAVELQGREHTTVAGIATLAVMRLAQQRHAARQN